MNTFEQIKKQALNPEKTDNTKPCLGIIVPPSPFTVPNGWEFVLRQPFEGVSYLATVAHNAGYKVKIIDVRHTQNPVQEAIKEVSEGVDIVGVATYEDNFPFIEEVIRGIKEEDKEKLVILGGSLVTSVPSLIMENTLADIAALGEGELTIIELLDLITQGKLERLNEVKGICYKDNSGKLVFSEKRPQMEDLNSLPVMNLSLWPGVKKDPVIKEILFSHSRGCYMNCSFCYRTTPKLSLKSPEKFRQELKELKAKHNFEFLYFVDLTFAIDKKRTLEICEVIKDFHARWSCMCRVQNLDAEMLRKMKESGCQIALYGFESVSQDILDKAHKGITPDEIRRIIRMTRDSGIQVGGFFILGLPGETEVSLNRVLEFINETDTACRVKYLSAIPGTEIYRQALKDGLIKSEIQHLRWLSKEKGTFDDEFINLTKLPDEKLREVYKKINSMYIKGPRFVQDWF
jgi:radical SAM superfamily enzyme YgiQ (UPF0313 family)